MRKWLFFLFFGSDALASSMAGLLDLRRKAAKRVSRNNEIKRKLAIQQERLRNGQQVVRDLHNDYNLTKVQLEKAYDFGFEVE